MEESDKSFKSQSDTKLLSKSILDVLRITNKHKLKVWLNYGALLGMIRENRLLPWNNDAELSCFYDQDIEEKAKSIVKELSKKDFNAYYYSTLGTINIKKPGVDININFIWIENSLGVRPHNECDKFNFRYLRSYIAFWLAVSMSIYTTNFSISKIIRAGSKEKVKIILIAISKIFPKVIRKVLYRLLMYLAKSRKIIVDGKTAIPLKYFNDFREIDFYGSKVFVPSKSNELLEFIYGESWHKPKENWSFYEHRNKNVTSIKMINEPIKEKELIII
tara:strand:+ start:66 stop:893 length:828 start_codon:yes stop_codon:yes gene_type:complete